MLICYILDMAKICIALATYNGEKYLSKMLDSLVMQTRKADLVIAVDDGSKDRSVEILQEYQERLPLQITALQQNGGHRAAFSKALEIAKKQLNENDLVALADQDDIWLPNKLDILEKNIETPNENGKKPILVYGDAQIIDAKGNVIDKSWRKLAHICTMLPTKAHIAGTNNVTGCLSLFRASLLSKITPIPTAVNVHDAWISLIAQKQGSVRPIDEPVVQYRLHDNNSVGLGNKFSFDETCQRQVTWTSLLVEQGPTIPLDKDEIDFANQLNHYWVQRSKKAFLPRFLPFLIRNRGLLFPDPRTRNRKILFSLLGSPAVHFLFGKDK
jgi:glycosyltransferase involved in cell wall biosynthesis